MKRPNIVFILIDDMGWKDLNCYGSSFYETPNIDRLAREGMRFTDAYAACPVCSPTRASILTGKYPATVGITDWIDAHGHLHPARGRVIDVPYLKHLPQQEHSLARALNGGGYQTWHVGKWHLGCDGHLPEDHGFDVNIGGAHQGSPGSGGYFSPWTIPPLENADVPAGTYLTDYLTDQTLELLHQRDDRPFFLKLCYSSVHTPIQAKAEKIAKYEAKAKAMGLDQVQTFAEGELFPCQHKQGQRIKRRLVQSDPVYAAMIESLDENLGRLFDQLDALGEGEVAPRVAHVGERPPAEEAPVEEVRVHDDDDGRRRRVEDLLDRRLHPLHGVRQAVGREHVPRAGGRPDRERAHGARRRPRLRLGRKRDTEQRWTPDILVETRTTEQSPSPTLLNNRKPRRSPRSRAASSRGLCA